VKLLFDENLSPRLVGLLDEEYPGSAHVRDVGLAGTPDSIIWNYAIDHGFVIVSKDDDFRQRSFLEGATPTVVWRQVANAGTTMITALLRDEAVRLDEFALEDESSLLILRAAV